MCAFFRLPVFQCNVFTKKTGIAGFVGLPLSSCLKEYKPYPAKMQSLAMVICTVEVLRYKFARQVAVTCTKSSQDNPWVGLWNTG